VSDYGFREKMVIKKNRKIIFLSKSLPWGHWFFIDCANISAEQFIGMSGSGFALGLAIASYEWMALFTLL
jgi:SSS family solute:Na+ symporter